VAARRVADHIRSEHFERAFTAAEVTEVLPHVIYHLESADVDLCAARRRRISRPSLRDST